MELIAFIVSMMIIFCLLYLRYIVVMKEADEWNYKVYKYEKYCILHNHYCEDFEANRINPAQAVFVFIMIWKIRQRFFFDMAPDWAEIDSLIYSRQI